MATKKAAKKKAAKKKIGNQSDQQIKRLRKGLANGGFIEGEDFTITEKQAWERNEAIECAENEVEQDENETD